MFIRPAIKALGSWGYDGGFMDNAKFFMHKSAYVAHLTKLVGTSPMENIALSHTGAWAGQLHYMKA